METIKPTPGLGVSHLDVVAMPKRRKAELPVSLIQSEQDLYVAGRDLSKAAIVLEKLSKHLEFLHALTEDDTNNSRLLNPLWPCLRKGLQDTYPWSKGFETEKEWREYLQAENGSEENNKAFTLLREKWIPNVVRKKEKWRSN